MERLRLTILVCFISFCFNVDAFGSDNKVISSLDQITTLEIKTVISDSSSAMISTESIVYKKHRTTLRKPLAKKWKSKNWNLC